MAKKIIPFPNPQNQSQGGDEVQDIVIVPDEKPWVNPPIPKIADLFSMVCLLDAKDIIQAAKVSTYNWRSIPSLRWRTRPDAEAYWALFPIDHDESKDIVRECNWLALQDTLSNFNQWQVKFLRFQHPETTCLKVLGIQVGFGTVASLTPAFRLFHECVDKLQKNVPIDETYYQNIWEDEIKEQIRRLGEAHIRPGEQADDLSDYGAHFILGWTTKVLRYIMNRSPELLSADIGKLPTLKETDVLTALKMMGLCRLDTLARNELIGVGP